MTDEEIWLEIKWLEERDQEDVAGLLRELLQRRTIHAGAKYLVWQPDDSSQGWKCLGMFPDKGIANYFRERCCMKVSLVLPPNEVPALTAR